ncbi:type I-E CRISPR-associated protein Cas6/Cse3/CasE [Escherichia coli]|uniref:type I-E CRISPR-associated protein Cas6/Cse3/CasE n=2 Tax=Escherichia coli TaxID=562 RepID=UPI002079CD53|nr:type I-E CRISPR-associated protein Cas6/Cse3/CasE [Escherichia coli]
MTPPGCSFKSSAVAVWGTHHQSGAVAQQGGTMYLSRITLHTGQLSPAQLLHLVDRGEYVMHQWLWDLFPGGKERQFLYRREELQGAFRFFVLSQERPAESETFTIECRSFTPELSTGQQLCFNLRANPTICKAGKRHDLLMEAKRQVYGISEAAVLAAGYAPAIGFIHSGKPLSFVYDIADIIKFDLVVPKAFEIAARQPAEPDKEVRLACRDIFRSSKLTGKLIPLIEEVLAAGEIEPPQPAPDMLPPAIPEPETLGDSGHRGRGG